MNLFRYLLLLFVFANTRCLFVATLWSPVGKSRPLDFIECDCCLVIFVTFLFDVLG